MNAHDVARYIANHVSATDRHRAHDTHHPPSNPTHWPLCMPSPTNSTTTRTTLTAATR